MKWLCGVRLAAVPLSGNNLRQPVHSHVPGSITRIGTGQRAVIPPRGWEGNRRSGVAPEHASYTLVAYPSRPNTHFTPSTRSYKAAVLSSRVGRCELGLRKGDEYEITSDKYI